jgi:hypothetical protein
MIEIQDHDLLDVRGADGAVLGTDVGDDAASLARCGMDITPCRAGVDGRAPESVEADHE